MRKTASLLIALTTAFATACKSTPEKPKADKGPDDTIPYLVEVDSSEPGARIEANNEYIGKTPLVLKIYGDEDGTFHNFGRYEYEVVASPVRAGQQQQRKVFKCGGWFTSEDKIPKKIFFDFGSSPDAAR